jgi:hypothetical protein
MSQTNIPSAARGIGIPTAYSFSAGLALLSIFLEVGRESD